MTEEYVQEKWSLDDLFPDIDSPELQEASKHLEEKVKVIEDVRPKLTEELTQEELLEILAKYEELIRLLRRIVSYGHLRFAEDTQDQAAQTYLGQVQQLTAEVDNRTMFFSLWWKALEDDVAEDLLAGAGDYAYWLEALRLQKPYTLTEPEEKVINLKDVNGSQAMVNLYTAITNRYAFTLEDNGEVKELTRGELSVYYRSPDPDLRKAAYQELYRVYGKDTPILGQIYQYRARDWRSELVDLRGFASPIAARNLSNNVPDEVVDALINACKENSSIFHRFYRLKARWLGVDRIRRYDIYAPVTETDKSYPFSEAIEMILESFNQFDEQFADLSMKVLSEHHLDSEVRKGKRSGAFCATVGPDLTPWVLTSYQGKPDNVATLAHELGHAVHSLVANHHTALTQDASLPLAETASTFGEMLLVDHLLATDPDPGVQRDLLFKQMDDAYATVMRQAYFADFERTAHDMIKSGAAVDDLSQAYVENLEDQFGDSLDLSDDFRIEWVAIPHIYHTPFYVYAYAFGQLLVYSLYRQYMEDGKRFKSRYMEILSAGGSDAPVRILDKAGVDVRSPEFWQGGFDFLEGQIEKLEEIEIPA
ncbi:MAG: M3 family oligoendopeptidase [Anaerolineales bacterium]|nr:M3 family oligoendopeptidase [Anaerolineales bacterium]